MIVFHNAWQYYNDRFGITTLGFVERNPGQEPNPQQVAQIGGSRQAAQRATASLASRNTARRFCTRIAQGADIKVVEDLYDDSIGTNPQVSNYTSMLVYDTNIIVKALK